MLKRIKNNCGAGYIDVVVMVLSVMMIIALAVSVFPVYIAKSRLDTFAQELCREAEICGVVGSETSSREAVLQEQLEIEPKVTWSKTGNIQINEEITVTVEMEYDIGFGGLGSFPVKLQAKASGKSEVYHK
jgi:hypothetical protein